MPQQDDKIVPVEFKAVLTDIDGTRVLSEMRNRDVIEKLAAQHGALIQKDDWKFLAGQAEVKIWDSLKSRFNGITIGRDEFAKACRIGYLTSSFNVAARPGMEESFAYYYQQGLVIAGVTNSPRAIAQHSLNVSGGAKDTPLLITECDVLAAGRNPKPHPDPYLMAADLLGIAPKHCLVYEDSGTGVASGLAAGMTVVHICDDGLPDVLQAHHYVHCKDSLIQLAYKLVPPRPRP